MSAMQSTEIKYIELIRDLTHKPEFRQAVLEYRQKLGIPPGGFRSDKQESQFIGALEFDLLDETEKSPSQLIRRHRKDKALLEQALQWKDLLDEGPQTRALLKRHQLPLRAGYMLYYFILYAPVYLKNIEQKLYKENELRDYGCALHCGFVDQDGQIFTHRVVKAVRKLKEFHIYDDMTALISIYPEAQRSDVIRLINECWENQIRPVQIAQAKRSKLRTGQVRKKVFREQYDKILRLRKKGTSTLAIAQQLGLDNEAGRNYVRKIVSIARQREN